MRVGPHFPSTKEIKSTKWVAGVVTKPWGYIRILELIIGPTDGIKADGWTSLRSCLGSSQEIPPKSGQGGLRRVLTQDTRGDSST